MNDDRRVTELDRRELRDAMTECFARAKEACGEVDGKGWLNRMEAMIEVGMEMASVMHMADNAALMVLAAYGLAHFKHDLAVAEKAPHN